MSRRHLTDAGVANCPGCNQLIVPDEDLFHLHVESNTYWCWLCIHQTLEARLERRGVQRAHGDGCWRLHLDCAVEKVEALERERDSIRGGA